MLNNVLKLFQNELPAPVPASAGVGLGPISRQTIRPTPADIPQHLTLPTEPFVLLANHADLDVMVARLPGFCGVYLYAAGLPVTLDITIAEASWLCSGPTELVKATLLEKYGVSV